MSPFKPGESCSINKATALVFRKASTYKKGKTQSSKNCAELHSNYPGALNEQEQWVSKSRSTAVRMENTTIMNK